MKTLKNKITLLYLLTYGLLIFILCVFLYFEIRSVEYRRIDNSLLQYSNDILRTLQISESDNLITLSGNKELGFVIFVEEELMAEFRTDIELNGKILDGFDKTNKYRYYKTTSIIRDEKYELYATYNMKESEESLNRVLLIIILLSSLTVLLISIFGRIFTRKLLLPLNQIGKQMEELGKERTPHKRISVKTTGQEIEKLQCEINTSLNQIEKLINETKSISARIAHQFRTPLAVLKSNIQLTQRKVREENIKNELEESIVEIDKLNNIITNFLILSKIENGILEEKKLFDLSQTIISTIEKNIIIHNEIEFIINVIPEIYFRGIKTLIEIALDNLIDNAAKYSTKKIIKIDLIKKENIEMVISNSGEETESIRVNEILKNRIKEKKIEKMSFGIGLEVVKEIIKIHNAKIKYQYVDGQNKFVVEFKNE